MRAARRRTRALGELVSLHASGDRIPSQESFWIKACPAGSKATRAPPGDKWDPRLPTLVPGPCGLVCERGQCLMEQGCSANAGFEHCHQNVVCVLELESSRTPKPAPSRSVCKRNGEQTNDQRGRNQDTAWPPRVPGNFRLTGHLTKTRMRVTGSFRSMNHLTRRLSSSSDYHGHKLLAAKGADCR